MYLRLDRLSPEMKGEADSDRAMRALKRMSSAAENLARKSGIELCLINQTTRVLKGAFQAAGGRVIGCDKTDVLQSQNRPTKQGMKHAAAGG